MTPQSPRTVPGLVRRSASADPLAAAVLGVRSGERLTYGELVQRIDAVAAALRSRGVNRGDRVLVVLPEGPAALVAVLGAMAAAISAPMNPAYPLAELGALADDIAPAAVVTSAASTEPAARLAAERGLALVEVDPAGDLKQPEAVERPDEPAATDVALLLHTAGTTARPKQVPLTHGNLAAAADNVVRSLQLTPSDRCLNVMPLFHSHGLLGAAMSTLRAGGSIVCSPGLDPRHVLRWAVDLECSWYTAASTLHHLVLEAPGEWPGLRFMRSASGPLAPQIAVGLEQRFGAPMIEVYGMTEAYQIAANPLPPGERRLGTVGRPTGTEVGVLCADGAVRQQDADGEILVRGPAVFAGYSSPPGANDDAFVDGWFRTGDLGRISADGYLTITGRVKEQINRGGEKIAPREVEEALLDHPDVVEAMVFAFPDPILGEEVGVAVVPRDGATVELPALRGFLEGRIAAFKAPRQMLLVDRIPKTSTGKPQRLQFAREHAAELAPQTPTGVVAAAGDTQARLAVMWRDILRLDHTPGPDARFFDLGGTSLAVMELVVRIEEDFGVDLPLMRVLEVPVLADLARQLDGGEGASRRGSLLHHYREGSTGVALVLVPGQFGLAVGLDLIAGAVDADVDVWLFDYPGHRPGESPAASIDELARVLVQQLSAAQVTGDVALYGNSLGSWVVFEAGRLLAAMGSPPLFVGIGDLYSPVFAGKTSTSRPSAARRLRNRVQRVRRHALRWRVRASRATPAAARRQETVLTASGRALRSYNVRPYDGDLVVMSTPARAAAFGAELGWEQHTAGRIRTVTVPATHDSMHRTQPRLIGQALGEALRYARAVPGDEGKPANARQ